MTNKTKSTLNQLAEVSEQIKAMQADFALQLNTLQAEEQALRSELEETMKTRGIKSQVDEATGYTATYVERTNLEIVDEDAVIQELKDRKVLDKCLKFDSYAAKWEHKSQPLAGIKEVTSSHIQIKAGEVAA